VLFLCTGNSAVSLIAGALVQQLADGIVTPVNAGGHPELNAAPCCSSGTSTSKARSSSI